MNYRKLFGTFCLFITIILYSLFLSSCKLYTIVRLNKNENTGIKIYFENPSFDAEKYVDSIWRNKVIPYMVEKANDINLVIKELSINKDRAGTKYGIRSSSEGCPWNYVVKGKGIIISVNKASRNGNIAIDLPPYNHNGDIKVQIGPVFKGTSIRDALTFISFEDFRNQLEYAKLANAFNQKVYNEVFHNINFNRLINKEIKFIGVFTDNSSAEILLTPVKIEGGQ